VKDCISTAPNKEIDNIFNMINNYNNKLNFTIEREQNNKLNF